MAATPPAMDREQYEYHPLPNPELYIRTLVLKAELVRLSTGEEVPQGSLRVDRLPADPPYMALSYCWGDAANTAIMVIDGKMKRITRNLSNYLLQKARKLQDLQAEDHFCWIDALSINQEDDQEKSHQVQMMRWIFSKALVVEAWVGPAALDSLNAFECMRDLSKFLADADQQLLAQEFDQNRFRSDLLSYVIDNLVERVVPLQHLLEREWWRRIWVQQEVYITPVDRLVVVCGDHRIQWAHVVATFLVLRSAPCTRDSLRRFNLPPDQAESLTDRIKDIMCRMMPYLTQHPKTIPCDSDPANAHSLIWRLLYNNMLGDRGPRATFPVDYVYGLFGMCPDRDSLSRYVDVDYSKSATEVFIQVSRYLYTCHPTLMLCLANRSAHMNANVPSWVVDWTATLDFPMSYVTNLDGTLKSSGLYSASDGLHTDCFRIIDNVLQLHGFQIGTVSISGWDTSEELRQDDSDPVHQASWLRAYDEFIQYCSGTRICFTDSVVWRLPIADQDSHIRRRISGCMMPAFQEVLTCAKNGTAADTFANLSDQAELYRHANNLIRIRRVPFLTTDGKLGIGPKHLGSSDAVFIVGGVDTPFIFRKVSDGQYRIVGECYLYGVMDGEAVENNVVVETLEII